LSDVSMITAPAASAVISLWWPKAIPTVAVTSAGASLMPSPMNSVGARAVSSRRRPQLVTVRVACRRLRQPEHSPQLAIVSQASATCVAPPDGPVHQADGKSHVVRGQFLMPSGMGAAI
jgi:hypothetical protein